MSWLAMVLSMVLVLSVTTGARADSESPKIVRITLNKAFVPIGFDDNDKVQVVVQGTLPDTCYKVGSYTTHIDESAKTIRIEQNLYEYKGICLTVTLPFIQVVDLGLLKSGSYTLLDSNSANQLGNLPVTRASSPGPDEYLYAPVRDAFVQGSSENKNILVLTGNFTSRCQKMKEVRMHYYDEVVVVQPIMEFTSQPDDCGIEKVRFSHSVALKEGLNKNFLLHVRTMDGQAINKIIDLP